MKEAEATSSSAPTSPGQQKANEEEKNIDPTKLFDVSDKSTDENDWCEDFVSEMEKLQETLDDMMRCANSPSTSIDSNTVDKSALSQRRLVRVPCEGFSSRSSHSDSGTYSSAPMLTLPFTIYGGASAGRLILVDIVRRHDLIGLLNPNDIVLSLDDIKVSGMTRTDVAKILERLSRDCDQIAVEVMSAGSMTNDVCEILADKKWADLQTVIRENLYSKTVPYTTRPRRDGEVEGEHYRFVTVEQFTQLQAEGQLLEHGTYQGHLYGTPRPEEGNEEDAMVNFGEGLLPQNWETAYTENGDKYYIDHNTGTTTWEDPRELPQGWEQVDDPVYGTFYVDHVNKKTQYERPAGLQQQLPPPRFDPMPSTISNGGNHYGSFKQINGNGTVKSYERDSGFEHSPNSFGRPLSGTNGTISRRSNPLFTTDPTKLCGDLIDTRIVKGPKGLGFTLIGNDASSRGDEFIQVKSVLAGGPAAVNGMLRTGDVLVRVNGRLLLGATQKEACDVFVSIPIGEPVELQVCRGYELLIDPTNRIITENVYATYRGRDHHEIDIFKGAEGFGFTIADSVNGQRVKKILYPAQCPNLIEGDTIVELDGRSVRAAPHTQLVEMLRELPVGYRGKLVVKRGSPKTRSRTPSAAFRYGEPDQRATSVTSAGTTATIRSKTPGPRNGSVEPLGQQLLPNGDGGTLGRAALQRQQAVGQEWDVTKIRPSSTSLGFATPNYIPVSAFREKPSDLITVSLIRKPVGFGFRLLGGNESNTPLSVGQIVSGGAAEEDGRLKEGDEIIEIDGHRVEKASHVEAVGLLEQAAHNKHVKMVVRRPRQDSRRGSLPTSDKAATYDVVIHRNESDGFGFVLMSSHLKNGSTIGQIQPNSPAARSGQLRVGDRVVAVNGIDILRLTHSEIISLIKDSGLTVKLTVAVPDEPPVVAFTSATLGRTSVTNGSVNGIQNGYGNYDSRDYGFPPQSSIYASIQPLPPVKTHSPYDDRIGETRSELSQGSLIDVDLERGSRGFGFSIRGGQEFGEMPLFVLRIADDGPAKADGRLQVGDKLISINGKDTKGMTHAEAIGLIKLNPMVRLQVLRSTI